MKGYKLRGNRGAGSAIATRLFWEVIVQYGKCDWIGPRGCGRLLVCCFKLQASSSKAKRAGIPGLEALTFKPRGLLVVALCEASKVSKLPKPGSKPAL